ncbi:MAG TPA: glutamine synthetase family protein [Steroidobacteraceae bacterium]|nr:glutamine synthetase family protein [Steroidobacteraceae bacterium]
MSGPSLPGAGLGKPAELAAFLAAHPDVEAVQIMITDPSGVLRGKSVRRNELERIYDAGRQVAGSILGLDITGEDVDETGLVWDTGDADMCARPIAGTLVRAPWLAVPTGQLMLTMFDAQGAPAPADPRHTLVRAIDALMARGLTPVVACEIEFYLLKEEAGGRLAPAGGGRASERQKIDAYSLQRLDDLAPLFADVYVAAQAQGLPAETLMSEYAPGQFEITLRHRADALRAVDEAVMFKRVLRGVAQKHGLIACFMAKPFTQRAGSGLHVHVSMADAAGRNLFASDDPAGTPLLRQAIGGMKAVMAESLAVFAPNANSYRRFVSKSYAPMAPIWGINNRSVSLRVPAGPPVSRHIEHRIAGADANLYLAVAAVLGAAAHGIEHALDPGAPVEGNGYAQGGDRSLPGSWRRALMLAERSEFLRDTLGAEFMKIFLAIKQQECARFSAEVSELDYAWYLRA